MDEIMKLDMRFSRIHTNNRTCVINKHTSELMNMTGVVEMFGDEVVHLVGGFVHNETGPAIIFSDGFMLWCIHGEVFYNFRVWLNALDACAETKLMLGLKYG